MRAFEVSAELDSSSKLADMLGADIVVDVTSPVVSPDIVTCAIANGMKVLVGTSGWSADRLDTLQKKGRRDAWGACDGGAQLLPRQCCRHLPRHRCGPVL
jgi:dihydrodipicolinate reductase